MATSIKISQLPAKGSNLEATDLLEVSEFNGTGYVSKSITGQEIIDSVPSSVTAWGTITGTLSAQTDLNTALSGKQATVTLTTTGTGAATFVSNVLNVPTPAAATFSSLTTTGSSGASTLTSGVLNVPTYSLSGLGGVPTTRTLTINGTTQDLSADRTFTISTGITIGTTAITSGTVGRVLFEGTGNVVQESANFTYDNTNGIFNITGIINSVIQHTALTNYTGFGGFQLNVSGGSERAFLKLNPQTGEVKIGATGSGYFTTLYAQGLEAMRIFSSTRNIGINTTTDAGFKLDVNGTARVSGNLELPFFSLILRAGISGYAGVGNVLLGNNSNIRSMNPSNNGTINLIKSNASGYIEIGGGNNGGTIINPTAEPLVIGDSTIVNSAICAINSTAKGFLPPRLTTTQKNAIATPATGLQIYDSTLNRPCFYDGTTWITL